MIITEITEISKARSRVTLDEEIAFVLYKGDLRIHHLKIGEEMTQETYRELMEVTLPKRAKLRSMNLLKARDYTVTELRRKLHRGGYPDSVIEIAIAYVESYGYVGDISYARKYITTYWNSKNRRCIEQKLLEKGIQRETIRQIYSEILEEEEDPEIEQIVRLLQKRHFSKEESSREEQMKIFTFLVRKGYSSEKIRRCIGYNDVF